MIAKAQRGRREESLAYTCALPRISFGAGASQPVFMGAVRAGTLVGFRHLWLRISWHLRAELPLKALGVGQAPNAKGVTDTSVFEESVPA